MVDNIAIGSQMFNIHTHTGNVEIRQSMWMFDCSCEYIQHNTIIILMWKKCIKPIIWSEKNWKFLLLFNSQQRWHFINGHLCRKKFLFSWQIHTTTSVFFLMMIMIFFLLSIYPFIIIIIALTHNNTSSKNSKINVQYWVSESVCIDFSYLVHQIIEGFKNSLERNRFEQTESILMKKRKKILQLSLIKISIKTTLPMLSCYIFR